MAILVGSITANKLKKLRYIRIRKVIFYLIILLVLSSTFPEGKLGYNKLILVLPYQYGNSSVNLPYIFEYLIFLLFIVFFFGLISKKLQLKLKWYTIIGLIFLFQALFVLPLSYLLGFGFSSLAFGKARLLIESLMLFLIVSNVTWRISEIRYIILTFILVSIFHGLILFLSYIDLFSLPFRINKIVHSSYVRYLGVTTQPSRISLLLAIGLILSIRFPYKRFDWKFLHFLVVGSQLLIMFSLFLTQTRGSIFSFLASFLITSLFFRSSKKKLFLLFQNIIIFVIFLGIFFFTDLNQIISDRFLNLFNLKNLIGVLKNTRYDKWIGAIEIIKEHPFGIGYGFVPKIGHPHSDVINWILIFGIHGFILYSCFIYIMYKQIKIKLQKLTFRRERLLYISLISGIFVYFISGILETSYFITPSSYWFWLFAGLFVADDKNSMIKNGFKSTFRKENGR